ncbi:hypothetical protein ACTHSS_11325, partial [Neisseria sp. P0009.S003]
PMYNPRGEQIYWIGPVGHVSDSEECTDFGECASGFITITPLQVDLTAYGQLEQTASFWSEIPAPEPSLTAEHLRNKHIFIMICS